MPKNSDIKLLEDLFLSSYYSFNNLKYIKCHNCDSNIKKIYSETLDIFYDGMDTVMEILDICGADK